MSAQPEKQIENAILAYLAASDVFSFKIKSTGTFDTKLGRFRRPAANYMRGVSDILGIYRGRPFACEVKSALGRLSQHQKIFLERFQREGGIAITARSVEDVRKVLRAVDQETGGV